jgi:hypothetical protein
MSVPYKYGTDEQYSNKSVLTSATSTSTTVNITVADYTAYKFRIQNVGAYGVNYGASYSAMVYLSNSVSTPANRNYEYEPTYTHINSTFSNSSVTYTNVSMSDVTFALTTVGGAAAWKVSPNSNPTVFDTLIGVRKVILSDTTVVLFGSGSGNTFIDTNNTDWSVSATYGVTSGSYLLFAAGETYTRNTSSNNREWIFDVGVTMKGIGMSETKTKPIISIVSIGIWMPRIYSSNVTIENITFDSNNISRGGSLILIASNGGYPMTLLSNINMKNLEFKNMSGTTACVDLHYISNSTIEDCSFGETDSYSLDIAACTNITVKGCTIPRSLNGSVYLGATSQTYLAANSSASLTASGPLASLFGKNGNVDVSDNICYYLINRNIDMSDNNFTDSTITPANKPWINIDSQRYQNYEILKDSDGNRIMDASSNNYFDFTKPLSLSQTFTNTGESGKHIKLPAGFGYSFMWDYSLATMQAGISQSYYNPSTGRRATPLMTELLAGMKQQMPRYTFTKDSTDLSASLTNPPTTVTTLSNNTRIYPAGYEAAPDAPVVTATRHADGGRIDLSWSAVTANAGSGMDADAPYTVSVSPSAGTVTLSEDKLSASVTGLTNGVTYTFTVTAKNTAGLTSSASKSATPATLPGAPTGLSFTPHDTAISVSCVDPANIGANSIVSYRVKVYSDANGDNELSSKMVESSTLPIEIAGLSDGVDYYFRVDVKNDVLTDYGSPSAISSAQRTVTSPGAPQNVSVAAGYKKIVIEWAAPSVTGGNTAFPSYKVRIDGVNDDITVSSGTTLTIDSNNFSSITAGQAYSVAVCAIGNIDNTPGAFSSFEAVTPFSEPAAPAAPSVVSRTSSSLTLSWSAPAANGSPITGYKLLKDGVMVAENIIVGTYELTGLDANTEYTFRVYAKNIVDYSEASAEFAASTLAAAPTEVDVTAINRNLTVSFTAPAKTDGILFYSVKVNGNVESSTSSTESRTIQFSVAPNITSVVIKVFAVTTDGNGDDSDPITITLFNNPVTGATDIIVSTEINEFNASTQSSIDAASSSTTTSTPAIFTSVPNPNNITQPLPKILGISLTLPANSTTANDVLARATIAAAGNPGIIAISSASIPPMVAYVFPVSLPSEPISAMDTTAPYAGKITVDTSNVADEGASNITLGLKTSTGADGKPNDTIIIKAAKADGSSIDLATNPVPVTLVYPKTRVAKSGGGYYNTLTLTHATTNETVVCSLLDESFSTETTVSYRGIIDKNFKFDINASDSVVPICFLGNTPIQTPNGYKRIDSLRVGDKVATADGRAVAIQRVLKKSYAPSVSVNPLVIPAGQFGATENVMISPSHRVAVPGRGMIEAHKLGLKQMSMRTAFDYYNLELPNWETDNLVAAGVEVESLAPVRRLEITKAEFTALLKAKYGRITPAVISRACRTCFMTTDGKVNIPVIKKASK